MKRKKKKMLSEKDMKIDLNRVRRHVPDEMHMRSFLVGTRIVKPKRGKGSFSRRPKHRQRY